MIPRRTNRARARSKTAARHTDDWLMTYADMITLLLCFFVIMVFIVHDRQSPQHPAPVVESKRVESKIEKSAVPIDVAPLPSLQKVSVMVRDVTIPPLVPPIDKLTDVTQGNLPFHDIELAKDDESETPISVNVALDPVPAAPVAAIPIIAPATVAANDQLPPVSLKLKGERLTTLDISSAAFFDSGSAILSNSGKAILKDVAHDLREGIFKGYGVTVEGHTDDQPITTNLFPSNWELSTARAAAVVRFLIEDGLPADHLRAAGYADTLPKAPNRDAQGNAIPANQAQNRRVVIKLEKIDRG